MSTCEDITRAVQQQLAALGYYRLRVDGLPGPGTSDAVVRFKAANGLRARAFVGPVTLAALFAADAVPAPVASPIHGEPAWLAEARNRLGVRETRGPGNTAEIMRWAADLDQWYPGDDVAWCGLFVAHCMAAGAPDEPQDFNRLGARAWLKYGESAGCDIGSVCVLWRTHPTKSWHGHVFVVTGRAQGAVRGIGGNQSDAVTETWFSSGRVLGYRKPVGAILADAPIAPKSSLSRNEA